MYLLPHFIMMLIGKPGSGKTTLLKQLLTNEQMYYKKFDHVILVSPSHAKMDLKLKKENVASSFSLDWLFKKIDEINEKQLENVFGKKMD
jgi:septin family protein